MIIVHLHQLLFHAYHGIHDEERILGNQFEVNADVTIDNNNEAVKHLKQTVNYVTVYELIKQRMQQATPLLETLAQEMAQAIEAMDSRIRTVSINIKKISPPIENFQGVVAVSYKTGA